MVGERCVQIAFIIYKRYRAQNNWLSFIAVLVTVRPHHGEEIILNHKKFLTFCESFDLYQTPLWCLLYLDVKRGNNLEHYLMQYVMVISKLTEWFLVGFHW